VHRRFDPPAVLGIVKRDLLAPGRREIVAQSAAVNQARYPRTARPVHRHLAAQMRCGVRDQQRNQLGAQLADPAGARLLVLAGFFIAIEDRQLGRPLLRPFLAEAEK